MDVGDDPLAVTIADEPVFSGTEIIAISKALDCTDDDDRGLRNLIDSLRARGWVEGVKTGKARTAIRNYTLRESLICRFALDLSALSSASDKICRLAVYAAGRALELGKGLQQGYLENLYVTISYDAGDVSGAFVGERSDRPVDFKKVGVQYVRVEYEITDIVLNFVGCAEKRLKEDPELALQWGMNLTFKTEAGDE